MEKGVSPTIKLYSIFIIVVIEYGFVELAYRALKLQSNSP